jgi:hypothetical protein
VKNERIVLCRTFLGLNDMLVQIEKCYRYCKKYKRKLYIDGSISGFLDDFSNYFVSRDANISFEKINFLTPPFDVFPKCLYNDLYYYESQHEKDNIYLYTTIDGIPITFNFKKNYEEQILVHTQIMGGDTGIFTLARLSLNEDIKLHIKKTIDDIKNQSGKKSKYDAIHVRNTGAYKTDYKSYFSKIRNKLNKTTVICTDDYEAQQYAKLFFGEKLIAVTDIPDLSSCAIRCLEMNKYIDRYKTNVDTLTDLFILACADRIFYVPIISDCYLNYNPYSNGPPLMYYLGSRAKSGYQILAKNLHDNKRIIKNMLYRKKNDLFSYRFALLECHFRYNFTIVVRKFRTFFTLLSEKGIPYTFKYTLRKILKFLSIKI